MKSNWIIGCVAAWALTPTASAACEAYEQHLAGTLPDAYEFSDDCTGVEKSIVLYNSGAEAQEDTAFYFLIYFTDPDKDDWISTEVFALANAWATFSALHLNRYEPDIALKLMDLYRGVLGRSIDQISNKHTLNMHEHETYPIRDEDLYRLFCVMSNHNQNIEILKLFESVAFRTCLSRRLNN